MKHRMGAVEGWVVTHDGETIKTGFPTDFEAVKWLHGRHSYSVDHAVKYEGYDVVFVRGGKVEYSYKQEAMKKAKPREELTPEELAQEFELAVRRAFVEVYGVPKDLEKVERSILSSYSPKGQRLAWTSPDPKAVLVLTEFAWVDEPYNDEQSAEKWDEVKSLLQSRGWERAGWDSINPAVQMVYFD